MHHPSTMDPQPPSSFFQPTNLPDSANSSPRRPDDAWDDNNTLPPVPGAAKLRLMCSYGGHIIPRPHDKSLCYVGGDTRIVVADRHSSLAELHSRLSHTLLNGRHFTLKYQLPTEDFDSLISLSTDEDLENMIEEYDRSNSASPLNPSRLRLFLFPLKPETAASMGSLLDDAKSETWFVDALNGAGFLPRGLSESAAIDNTLLELDNSDSCADIDDQARNESLGNNNKQVEGKINNVLDSPPMVETTNSSCGSSSSSPSMANLPPIKVRSEGYNQMVGLDEQFSHVSIANAAPPPLPSFSTVTAAAAVGGENMSRVVCDDEKSEKSDHGTVAAAPTTLRKPPLPLQPVQRKLVDIHKLPSPDSKHAGGYNLPSPDSVASDGSSVASAGSLQSKHTIYQDASQLMNRENRVSPTPYITDQNMMSNTQEPTSQVPSQQQQQQLMVDSSALPPPYQNQQQQYIHPSQATHYIQQHSAMPMSSYYPMYLQPQTQHQPPSIHHHHQTDPQYHHQMYLMPPTNFTQPSYDAASGRPLMPTPLYQTENVHQTFVQMPAHQYQQQQQQQQYVGLSQMPPTAQSNAGGGDYGYEYSQHHHNMQDQVYYAQPSQYQTMTPAAAVMLSQASAQLPADSNGQQS